MTVLPFRQLVRTFKEGSRLKKIEGKKMINFDGHTRYSTGKNTIPEKT
jgi:hypothetical protein